MGISSRGKNDEARVLPLSTSMTAPLTEVLPMSNPIDCMGALLEDQSWLTLPQYTDPGVILHLDRWKEGKTDEQEEVHGGADRYDAA